MSPHRGRDEGMPRHPTTVELPDLHQQRTEASPPTCPPGPTATRPDQPGSRPDNHGDNADDAASAPQLRACGPDHLVKHDTQAIDGLVVLRPGTERLPTARPE